MNVPASFLAKSSDFSLPFMPLCPENRINVALLFSDILVEGFQAVHPSDMIDTGELIASCLLYSQ